MSAHTSSPAGALEAALRSTVRGSVLGPDDSRFDDARRSFNGMIDRRPAVVVQPIDTADVATAVRLSTDAGFAVAVRGGGHSVAGHGVADGAVVVDLRRMRQARVEPGARRAIVAGGALWEDVDTASVAHGLAVPGGTFVDTGVGGLTLGGGIGWLMGIAGLTCDNLVGAEVVTADGTVVRAGPDGDPDLLWALRGGGGNFGVVSSFELALHPIGPLWGGYLVLGAEDAAAIIELVIAMQRDAPDELMMMPVLGETERDGNAEPSPAVSIGVAFAGPADEADRLMAPLRGAGFRVLADDLGPRSYLEIQAMNGTMAFGLRNYWKGHFVRQLDRSLIETIVARFEARPSRSFLFLLEPIHGAAKRVADDSAAFGARGAAWNVSPMGVWEDPSDDAHNVGWVRASADALAPHSFLGGGYVNYSPPDEPAERVLAAYGPERFARLQALKRRYDPHNRFRFNHNIPPA